MARARNIKPGLYKNEDLAECSIWARYLFPALWMMADREGRLEDRPKRIKGEVFPFDSIEVDPLLEELHNFGLIHRYEIDGLKVIQVVKFSTHQSPHGKEADSKLPDESGAYTTHERNKSGLVTGKYWNQKKEERDQHQTSTVLEPDQTDVNTSQARPDILIPDILIPEVNITPIASQPPPSPVAASENKKSSKTFRKWLEAVKASGESPIPSDDQIFEYAADAGLPDDFLRLHWIEFRARYIDDDKRYTDWRRVFRKSARGNWFKLWWINNGQYALTTLGQQAMSAMQAKEKRGE